MNKYLFVANKYLFDDKYLLYLCYVFGRTFRTAAAPISCRFRPLRSPSGRRSCVAERIGKATPAALRFHVGKHVVPARSLRDSILRPALSPFDTVVHSHTVVVGWRTNRTRPFSDRARIIFGRARNALTPIGVVAQSRTAVIGSRTDRIRAVSVRARVIIDRARVEFKPRVVVVQSHTAVIGLRTDR